MGYSQLGTCQTRHIPTRHRVKSSRHITISALDKYIYIYGIYKHMLINNHMGKRLVVIKKCRITPWQEKK